MSDDELADRATALLNDEVLQRAFTETRERIVGRIESAPRGDVQAHHDLALSLCVLSDIRTQLMKWVQDRAMRKHRSDIDHQIAKMKGKAPT